jgi:hypothetical protein
MYRRLLFILFFAQLFCGQTNAQERKSNPDSIMTAHDSLKIVRDSIFILSDSLSSKQDSINYNAIEEYSHKSKFTTFIHHLIFKSVATETRQQPKKTRIKKRKPYLKAEGKIVRDINIVTLDPFGYNIIDTSIYPKGFLIKTGDNLHIKTQSGIIKNLLLFKKNETYDSLLVNESERLIRSQKYIRDVNFIVLPASQKNDSVDVYIRVSDVWSIVPALSLSKSNIYFGLTDNNFAGLGNSFHGDMKHKSPENVNITRLSYLIPNIRSSYISLNIQLLIPGKNDMVKNYEFEKAFYSPVTSNLNYLFSDNKDLLKSIEFERPFYSPVTKWAGGIFLGQLVTAQSYTLLDSVRYLSSRTNIQDYWAAWSWQILKRNPADRQITSLVLSGRLLITRYPGRPSESESVNIFNNENSFFGGIGITSRKYIRDKYIFNYGKIEDFPVGRTLSITLGINSRQTDRFYLGLKAAWGDYFHFGYVSAHLEYGTFTGSTGFHQGVFTARINYFTRLLNLGNWKIRQFVRPTLILGINRFPSDNLTFSEVMKGFENLEYSASQMAVLTLQTQSYPPWNILGFHFGPYLFTSLGMLGNESSGFGHSSLYSSFGLGVLIKNNYLTFKTFQVSLTFYPLIPGNGYNVFKTNAYKTSDYGFNDFEISKPTVVDYH